MKRFALIGYPVAGSLSPSLFQAAYGGRYSYELLEDPSFEHAWARFLADFDGINVTAPFKLDACARVDTLHPHARQCGAVNLVVRSGNMTMGYNTDVDGVYESVSRSGVPVSEALIVGAGGAARAAAVAALRLGCRVSIANRTFDKAQALSNALGCRALPLEDVSRLDPDLVIYTLPGSAPLPSGLPLSRAVVLEAEYKHPVLADCPCRAYISGRQWLLWQAAAGYALFTGEDPDVKKMSALF